MHVRLAQVQQSLGRLNRRYFQNCRIRAPMSTGAPHFTYKCIGRYTYVFACHGIPIWIHVYMHMQIYMCIYIYIHTATREGCSATYCKKLWLCAVFEHFECKAWRMIGIHRLHEHTVRDPRAGVIYIYIHVCIYTCINTHMHTCIYICIYIYTATRAGFAAGVFQHTHPVIAKCFTTSWNTLDARVAA